MKAAKKYCHPPIVVNQDGTDAQVALQDMFEHTTNRILEDEDAAEMITADSMAQADQGGGHQPLPRKASSQESGVLSVRA